MYRLYFREGFSGSRIANDHAFVINERETSARRSAMIHGIDVGNQPRNTLPLWLNGTPTLELIQRSVGPQGPSRWEGQHALDYLKKLSGVDASSLGGDNMIIVAPPEEKASAPTAAVTEPGTFAGAKCSETPEEEKNASWGSSMGQFFENDEPIELRGD
jgi:hypothetical protein